MEKQKIYNTRKLVISALLIAIAVVLSLFDIPVPIGGAVGLRISVSGIVSKIPAVLFGPLWGAIVSGVTDILCHFAKPEGAFNPIFTITSALGGFMVGGLSVIIKVNSTEIKERFFKVFAYVTSILGVFGLINQAMLTYLAQSTYSKLLLSLGTTKSGIDIIDYINFTLISVLVITAVICLINLGYKKLSHDTNGMFVKLLLVLLISNVIVTTINSYIILKMYITSDIAILIFYIPRLAEEVIITCIQAAGMTYLLRLIKKIQKI